MKILVLVLTLSVGDFATQQHVPMSADEVTLRHKIYGDGRVTVFLLDIPPGQATLLHRHDRDMLSVFVNGGRTRASFNGAAPVEDSFTPGDVRFRSAGFTHSTENIGTERFLSVIFEFVDSQGPRESATRPATHICSPDDQTACVAEQPLFCTSKFCVVDLTMAPRAVRPADGATNDSMPRCRIRLHIPRGDSRNRGFGPHEEERRDRTDGSRSGEALDERGRSGPSHPGDGSIAAQ